MCEPTTCSTNLYGAGADRLAREHVVAVGLDVLLRQHHPFGRQRARQIGRDDERRLLGDDDHAVGRRRLDVLDQRPQRPRVAGGGALAIARWRLNFTSSEVISSPVWNLTPLRRWNVQRLWSAEFSHLEASPPAWDGWPSGVRPHEVVEHERQVVLDVVPLQCRIDRLGGEAGQGDRQLGLRLRPARPAGSNTATASISVDTATIGNALLMIDSSASRPGNRRDRRLSGGPRGQTVTRNVAAGQATPPGPT